MSSKVHFVSALSDTYFLLNTVVEKKMLFQMRLSTICTDERRGEIFSNTFLSVNVTEKIICTVIPQSTGMHQHLHTKQNTCF